MIKHFLTFYWATSQSLFACLPLYYIIIFAIMKWIENIIICVEDGRWNQQHLVIDILGACSPAAQHKRFHLAPVAACLPEKPKRSALNQLTRTLLRKYDCGVRPVHNWTSLTTVYIDLVLQSVLDAVGECSHDLHTLMFLCDTEARSPPADVKKIQIDILWRP